MGVGWDGGMRVQPPSRGTGRVGYAPSVWVFGGHVGRESLRRWDKGMYLHPTYVLQQVPGYFRPLLFAVPGQKKAAGGWHSLCALRANNGWDVVMLHEAAANLIHRIPKLACLLVLSGHARRKTHNNTTSPGLLVFLPSGPPSLSLSTAPIRPFNMADSGNAPKPSSSVKLVLLGEAAVGKVCTRRQSCHAVPSD